MKRFCSYCGEECEDEETLQEHMMLCIHSPDAKANIERYIEAEKKVYADLQRGVTTFDGIVDILREFLLKEGFNLQLDEMPSEFTHNVNARLYGGDCTLVNNKDTEDAGWKGNWRGKITPIDGFDFKGEDNDCSFWDLSGEMSGRYGFKFLRTSGGSWSSSFNGGGYILLNDFPQLLTQHIGEVKTEQTNEIINDEVEKIDNALLSAENTLVRADPFLQDCVEALAKIEKCRSSIASAKLKHDAHLRKNFIANTKIELPEIINPFVNLRPYIRLRDKFKPNQPDTLNTGDIHNARENIIEAVDIFEAFVDKNAEYFI